MAPENQHCFFFQAVWGTHSAGTVRITTPDTVHMVTALHANMILPQGACAGGTMPCDGMWNVDRVLKSFTMKLSFAHFSGGTLTRGRWA